MDVDLFIKHERQKKSPCCGGRIQIVYKTLQSNRTAAVYACLACDRLHVIDSRDEEKT